MIQVAKIFIKRVVTHKHIRADVGLVVFRVLVLIFLTFIIGLGFLLGVAYLIHFIENIDHYRLDSDSESETNAENKGKGKIGEESTSESEAEPAEETDNDKEVKAWLAGRRKHIQDLMVTQAKAQLKSVDEELKKDDLYKKSDWELSYADLERKNEALAQKDCHVDYLIKQFKDQVIVDAEAFVKSDDTSGNPSKKRHLEEDNEDEMEEK